MTLLTKLNTPALRDWYAREALAQSWGRETLTQQIRSQLHQRQGAAVTNFANTFPAAHAGLAAQILKDPYHFDFLALGEEAHERDIEHALMRHITRFLLELGAGFAYQGRQVRIEVGGDEFFIGLLLCRSNNRLVAEYALSGIDKPIGVAEYELARALPSPLDTNLPSIEEIETALSRELASDDPSFTDADPS